MVRFLDRIQSLPALGIGVSTEYGAAQGSSALDVPALRARHPEFASFLEIGVEVEKGLDDDAEAWLNAGHPVTYHFLDVNLDEPEDFDPQWLNAVADLVQIIKPAWMCGDAGLWHFGQRARGHMLLLPPILTRDSAMAQAQGVMHLRDRFGLEVFPENPPGQAFVGDLHILDFFAKVADEADTGILLDCAHLAIFQRIMGHAPTTGLDNFPIDRVVELHVAGARREEYQGWSYWEDDHCTDVLDDTWQIFDWVIERAPNLKAVVFECERNSIDEVVPGFERIQRGCREAGLWEGA